jgi:hypothetical protein
LPSPPPDSVTLEYAPGEAQPTYWPVELKYMVIPSRGYIMVEGRSTAGSSLALRRAQAVVEYLADECGLDASRLVPMTDTRGEDTVRVYVLRVSDK